MVCGSGRNGSCAHVHDSTCGDTPDGLPQEQHTSTGSVSNILWYSYKVLHTVQGFAG